MWPWTTIVAKKKLYRGKWDPRDPSGKPKTPHFGHTFGTGAEMGRVGGPQGMVTRSSPLPTTKGHCAPANAGPNFWQCPWSAWSWWAGWQDRMRSVVRVMRMRMRIRMRMRMRMMMRMRMRMRMIMMMMMMMMMFLWCWCIYDVDVYVTSV